MTIQAAAFVKRLTDTTPITKELFFKLGAKKRLNGDIPQIAMGPIVLFNFGTGPELLVNDDMDHPIKTVGQLRAVCLGLGITLTEQPNG